TDGANAGDGAVHVQYTDDVAPAATPTLSPAPNAKGWVRGNAIVTWNWSDALSGVDPDSCTPTTTVTDQGVSVATADCQDLAGNLGQATYRVRLDWSNPVVKLTLPKKARYHRGARVHAAYACSDKVSGVASCVGTTRKGKRIDTHTLGKHRFTVTATDKAGN